MIDQEYIDGWKVRLHDTQEHGIELEQQLETSRASWTSPETQALGPDLCKTLQIGITALEDGVAQNAKMVTAMEQQIKIWEDQLA
jgi:hypothetical protein